MPHIHLISYYFIIIIFLVSSGKQSIPPGTPNATPFIVVGNKFLRVNETSCTVTVQRDICHENATWNRP